MGIKTVIRDLIEKGIDPTTAVIGEDGLWHAPQTNPEADYQPSLGQPSGHLRNGLVLLENSTKNTISKPRKQRKTKAE